MRKLLAAILFFQTLGLATAYADENMSEVIMIDDTGRVIEPLYRDCDDPYRGWRETCRTSGRTCPPGYDGTPVTCKGKNGWYRCGTICESYFRG